MSDVILLGMLATKASKKSLAIVKSTMDIRDSHMPIKVATVDDTVYATTGEIDVVYQQSITEAGAAFAFGNYPGGASVVDLRLINGVVTHTVLRTYHQGLTIIDNSRQSKLFTWGGSEWIVNTPTVWDRVGFDVGDSLSAVKYVNYLDHIANDWKVYKITTTDGVPSRTIATVANNPTMTTPALAWTNRTTLTYA